MDETLMNILKESLTVEGQPVLSEDVIQKMGILFENTINEHKKLIEEKVTTELQEKNEQEIQEFKEGLTEKLDSYLDYFVSKFVEDNKQQIQESVKVKAAERVLNTFQKLVTDFNIQLSEQTISNDTEIAQLKEALNEAVNKRIDLENKIKEGKRQQMISEAASKVKVESVKSTFVKLAENFDFTSEEGFSKKLSTLAESLEVKETHKEKPLVIQEAVENQKTVPVVEEVKKTTGTERYLKYFNY